MKQKTPADTLMEFFNALYRAFGAQGWWPARTRFEVITGAILTQNTNWTNVEKAIKSLRKEGLLNPAATRAVSIKKLSKCIRPSGYFNVKAGRLKAFVKHLFHNHGGSLESLFRGATEDLRNELLAVKGIGPETADSILLYAARRPVFVVDAYTKRVLARHGLIDETAGYGEVQKVFMDNLPRDAALYNEYHALLVRVGKDFCRPKKPLCTACPLGVFLN